MNVRNGGLGFWNVMMGAKNDVIGIWRIVMNVRNNGAGVRNVATGISACGYLRFRLEVKCWQ